MGSGGAAEPEDGSEVDEVGGQTGQVSDDERGASSFNDAGGYHDHRDVEENGPGESDSLTVFLLPDRPGLRQRSEGEDDIREDGEQVYHELPPKGVVGVC